MYTHLTGYNFLLIILSIFNGKTPSIDNGFIAIDRAKLKIKLATNICNAASLARGPITGDCAIRYSDFAGEAIEDAATVAVLSSDHITRDGAIGQCEHVSIIDTATATRQPIII